MLDKVLSAKYILASKSPRRKNLLNQIGFNFKVVDSNAIEVTEKNAHKSVKINAQSKSRAVASKYKSRIIIGADTVVYLNQKILNKPKDLIEAKKYLRMLSGKKHVVYTGVNVINNVTCKEVYGHEKTVVEFKKLTDEEINYYVDKFKPLDKAGAYGIQDDFGCLFINKITGDYYNVVGLPLVRLYKLITLTL
ncbi:MAG: Maf family protein [Ignavibacteriae bacterium]|nr:Maf family protein [Ignavibacteriota bacterium]